ncbi:MAG: SIS domain-containing protein [Eubacterium sp.]|nr:SIS domain-containing protein [Candidatus Colimonas fimequi]
MLIFGLDNNTLEERNAVFTATEIAQQPATWKKTNEQVNGVAAELKAFVDQVITQPDFDVILTGAGTSEYVGNSLYPSLLQVLAGHVHSIGTTDIVATPRAFLSATKPTLLISFARSGNSPESVGAVEAAEKVCENIYHLFITCNKDGALAKLAAEKDNCFSIVLTDETHDKSFAMTSSFSNMYLAAMKTLANDKMNGLDAITDAAQKFIDEGYAKLADYIDNNSFDRIVYLGTDALKGIAQESALKVLELTAGQMVALYDTPMGFRHGPKSVVNDNTVCVVYISDNPATRRYEMDLLAELYRDKKGSQIIAVSAREDAKIDELSDLHINLGLEDKYENGQLALGFIVVAQALSMLYSLKLGLTPDNPCPTGEVNRVVKGVTIYEVE